MIKSMEHALDVQSVRVANRKRGYARAVRRFLKRNSGDWYGYNAKKQDLPVNFNKTPEDFNDDTGNETRLLGVLPARTRRNAKRHKTTA